MSDTNEFEYEVEVIPVPAAEESSEDTAVAVPQVEVTSSAVETQAEVELPEETPAPAQVEESEEATDQAAEEKPAYKNTTRFQSINIARPRKAIEERSERMNKRDTYDEITTWGMPTRMAISYRVKNGIESDLEDDDVAEAISHITPNDFLHDRVHRDGSQWDQTLRHKEKDIIPLWSRSRAVGGEVRGSEAVELLAQFCGRGMKLWHVLPHSCIYVRMRAPTDIEQINFDFELSKIREHIGLNTTGVLLSANSACFVETLVDLALRMVVDTNVQNLSEGMVTALRKRIDNRDYLHLINGLMATTAPEGHPWVIRCPNPKHKHSRNVTLNFARMQHIDKSALSIKQLDMLVDCNRKISDEQLAEYQAEFKTTDKNTIELENGVRIKLKHCTLDDQIQIGKEWVQSIETEYAKAMSEYVIEEQRTSYLHSSITARALRKYEYYVESISWPNDADENEWLTIVDRKTIRDSLEALSVVGANISKFDEGVTEYISNTTVAIIGHAIETFDGCDAAPFEASGNERLRSLVPVAVDRVFFTVVKLRTGVMAQLGQYVSGI